MKRLTAIIAFLFALASSAQTPWIHIYNSVSDLDFVSMPFGQFGGATMSGTTNPRMAIDLGDDNLTLRTQDVNKMVIGRNIPVLYLNTTENISDISDKVTLYDCQLTLDGDSITPDVGPLWCLLRGRGNSTLNYPKKPYNIKFPEKTKLYGFRKAKSYVLLANWIDPAYMRNFAAFAAARAVEMPYANHVQPVEVVLNGHKKGTYMLTEKCGFNNGSIDLSKEDEAESVMLELDTCDPVAGIFPAESAFSPGFRLPYQLKDPDAPTDPAEAQKWWYEWACDFEEMEAAVKEGKNLGEYIDLPTLARYIFTYNLACNQELNHPKSVMLWKTRGGKWQFGPCWDFDWAFGYQPTYKGYIYDEASEEELARYNRALKWFEEKYGSQGWGMDDYEGETLYWNGTGLLKIDWGTGTLSPWIIGGKKELPSYQAPLLGTGKNSHNVKRQGQIGFGGEFFMTMICGNEEFLAEYAKVCDLFLENADTFWAEWNEYADLLLPSGTRDAQVWNQNRELTHAKAVSELRTWIKNRIKAITDPELNYCLY